MNQNQYDRSSKTCQKWVSTRKMYSGKVFFVNDTLKKEKATKNVKHTCTYLKTITIHLVLVITLTEMNRVYLMCLYKNSDLFTTEKGKINGTRQN